MNETEVIAHKQKITANVNLKLQKWSRLWFSLILIIIFVWFKLQILLRIIFLAKYFDNYWSSDLYYVFSRVNLFGLVTNVTKNNSKSFWIGSQIFINSNKFEYGELCGDKVWFGFKWMLITVYKFNGWKRYFGNFCSKFTVKSL